MTPDDVQALQDGIRRLIDKDLEYLEHTMLGDEEELRREFIAGRISGLESALYLIPAVVTAKR